MEDQKKEILNKLEIIKSDFLNKLFDIRMRRNKKIREAWDKYEKEEIRKSI
jgi:hypothetical protein